MTEALTISPDRPADISMDYDRLRAEGVEHLEQLATQIWTDFNSHDPGITILEVLCYALTDLGYRANLPIADILASGGEQNGPVFFDQNEVLPNCPYTAKDYRKLFIDVAGVKNAWVFKYYSEGEFIPDEPSPLNGLYHVLLELQDGLDPDGKAAQAIIKRVKERYNAQRNLGEDLQRVSVVRDCPFCLCLDLELEADGNPTDILAAAMFAIQEYLAPHPQFHSFQELLSAGVRCEDILDGPLLRQGFLPDSELARSPFRQTIYRSDIMRILMETEGVKAVKHLMWRKAGEMDEVTGEPVDFHTKWCLTFKDCAVGPEAGTCEVFYQPYLDICCSKIGATRGVISRVYHEADLKDALRLLALERDMPVDRSTHKPAPGQYRPDLGDYLSVQYEFPENYALGIYDLPNTATPLQRGQQRQLQAFLTFFDQILASYLKQLAGVRDLLSVNQDPTAPTYLVDALCEVPGMDKLVKDFTGNDWEVFCQEGSGAYFEELNTITETATQKSLRRNRIMDHLLARFGEQFTEYSLQLFATQVAREEDPNTVDMATYLDNKARFLQEMPSLASERGKGYNYKAAPVWNSNNVAGLKKRVARFLGLADYAAASVICEPDYILRAKENRGGDKVTTQLLFQNRADQTILLSSVDFKGRQRKKAKTLLTELRPHLHRTELYQVMEEEAGNWQVGFPIPHSALALTDFSVDDPPPLQSPSFSSRQLAEQWLSAIVEIVERSDCDIEGFHLLEHILLRPNDDNDDLLSLEAPDCAAELADPYSFVVSVFLPNWPQRFRNKNYQQLVEQTFRREAPAHIFLRFCWLDRDQMQVFEGHYKNWREALAACGPDAECNVNEHANQLIEWLENNPCECPDPLNQNPDFCNPPPSEEPTGGSLA